MYSNAHQRNKGDKKSTIYNIAEQICEQVEGRNEALQIINAYRKVQDIKVPQQHIKKPQKKPTQQKPQPRKPISQYAAKVKQTLRELNANKKKQLQNTSTNKQITSKSVSLQPKKRLSSSQQHLIASGMKRFIRLLDRKYEQYVKCGFGRVVESGNSAGSEIEGRVRLWRLSRVFSGWSYEVMLGKIEKERVRKDEIERQKRMMNLAQSFHQFLTYKKVFKNWKQDTKRILKKRQLQLQQQLKRQEQLSRMQQQNKNQSKIPNKKQPTKQIQPNIQLKNKLNGFLNVLKQEIQGKHKISTIKENNVQQEQGQEQRQGEGEENDNVNQNGSGESGNNDNSNQQQNVGQGQQQEQQAQKVGPLTNQDLQKRRQQLQKKSKHRKQALQKLKKQREQKRKQQQQQKNAIQKQIQQQQKRIRQEQYRKFMKQKKEQQEWKVKEKELERQAVQFDRLRLINYYGWAQWTKLKACNQANGSIMANLLSKIILKRKLEQFVSNTMQIGEQRLKQSEEKVMKWYRRKLMKRCVQKMRQSKNQQLQLKQQLTARHQVNTIKIYFKQWLRTRHSIQLQNYEWQRPRNKKAQTLHFLTLLQKGFQSLKINRDQQIQNRNVEQHKAKIRQKVHKIVQEKPTINYDDFL